MEALALALGAALALVCVLFAARPFLREPRAADDRIGVPGAAEAERVRLEEERDRALAALKELEFDHRTGKISDADYRELLGALRDEAAGALRALDRVYGVERAGRNGPVTTTLDPSGARPRVPEPWPPPDEGVPDPAPTPAPGEPTPGPEEPAPPRR